MKKAWEEIDELKKEIDNLKKGKDFKMTTVIPDRPISRKSIFKGDD